jgi:hypothetical protein
MTEIDVETFKKAGFSYEEIESVKIWLDDIEKWNTIAYNDVKQLARKKIFFNAKTYA